MKAEGLHVHHLRLIRFLLEPHHEETRFLHICESKHNYSTADQCLCFRYTAMILQSLFILNWKFQASSSTLIRLRICVITQLKYEKTQLITIW